MRTTLIPALLLLCNLLSAQSTCEIWQWTGADSANKILANTQTFNPNGNIIFEKITGFTHDPLYPGAEQDVINVYSDTLLLSKTLVTPQRDSFRFEFQYDSLGRIVRMRSSRKEHVLKDTAKSGMFTIDIVAVDSTHGKWRFLSETRTTYDRWGRKILEEQKSSASDWVPKTEQQYDEHGRKSKFVYYVDGRIYWDYTYEYFDGGYRTMYTWYGDDGKTITNPAKDSPKYMQKQISEFKLDENGRILQVRNLNHEGKQIDRTVTAYNSYGKIGSETLFSDDDKVVLTHVYYYK